MVFPELLCEGFEPHKVTEVYLGGTNAPDVYVDIESSLHLKMAAIRAHVSQVGDGPRPDRPGWDLETVIRERAAAATGEPIGAEVRRVASTSTSACAEREAHRPARERANPSDQGHHSAQRAGLSSSAGEAPPPSSHAFHLVP